MTFSRFRMRLLKILDATLGYWLCWILGYLQYLKNPEKSSVSAILRDTPENILVIRPGGMGDMIILVPVLKHLAEKFPSARIDIICEKRNIEVLRMAGFEKQALAYDAGALRLLRHIRSRKYDLAIDTEQFHNLSAIIALLSRAPIRIGFKINPQRNLLYTHLVNYELDGYEGRQFARLLDPAGIRDFTYRLENSIAPEQAALPQHHQEKLKNLLKKGKVITIYPGSTSTYKQWSIGKFTELASALISERGCTVALIGSHSESDKVNAILEGNPHLKDRIISFAGILTLKETAGVIQQSSLFVSGDSGLAHLAIAVGTPTVVVFGPTDPAKWGLGDSRHRIVRNPMPCSPCFIFGYHKLCRSIECIAGISTANVLTLCDELLENTRK